jgi:hypothetical protein
MPLEFQYAYPSALPKRYPMSNVMRDMRVLETVNSKKDQDGA